MPERDNWVFYLAQAALENVQQQRFAQLQNSTQQTIYQSEIEAFEEGLEQLHQARAENRQRLAPLFAMLNRSSVTSKEKRELLEEIRRINPSDSLVVIALIYLDTMNAAWKTALENVLTFNAIPGRENRNRLRMGLLEAELLHLMGQPAEAATALAVFKRRVNDRWYRNIAECLLDERTDQSLISMAAEDPQYILTACTALGLWAEGSGDKQLSVSHYREALASYLDYLEEYNLARERLRMLRKKGE